MNLKFHIDRAGGVYTVAAWINLSPRSIYKWIKKDELPNTEYSGRTKYSEIIEINTKGKVKKVDLLDAGKPKPCLEVLP
ncbi:hypothetical protein NRA10_10480 [Acinetobacter baumannii]|nr:hypothetical protein Aba9102_16725 [Acinetobacter baumannii]EKF46102.1 hypothetical protein W9I_03250 [Acinetobacter nosocomialis Ab22222]MDC5042609.1 hypothetical protein [Acinetobacter baumannii]MDP7925137.1 hypothetical protein [Acinetobacter baumannii]OOT68509.1 hypothetical protein BTG99_01680 [Acinetobacter baumannii]